MFPLIRVDSRHAEALEPLGTKRKFWYREGGNKILFKAEERGTGEDWAEKVACELCTLLGLPHVHYEMAMDTEGDWPGVICESCAPPPTVLGLGNQLLLAIDANYPQEDHRKYKVRQHTIESVAAVLEVLEPPPQSWGLLPGGINWALDVFAGYLMLDAWIANQDRHHQNWGALLIKEEVYLAPTFDHGASMARNLSDAERQERLTTKDQRRHVGPFAARARSSFYADISQKNPMTTVEAWLAMAQKSPEAAKIWLGQLAQVETAAVEGIFAQVPPQRMSHVCRQFTQQLLAVNRERLLTGVNA